MSRLIDITGKRFGNMIAKSHLFSKNGITMWLMICDCGKEIELKTASFRRKHKPQLGCMECSRKRQTLHGMTNTKEFFAWRGILGRCTCETDEAYKNYGERGIKICDGWRTEFKNFFDDMGYAPTKKHSIDRENNDLNYSCGHCDECIKNGWDANCRWVVQKIQARNTRRNKIIEYKGEKKCLSEWAEILGYRYLVLFHRLKRGMDVEKAFTTPSGDLFEKITFNGKSLTIAKWSAETGINKQLIRQRLKKGWQPEDIFNPSKYIK